MRVNLALAFCLSIISIPRLGLAQTNPVSSQMNSMIINASNAPVGLPLTDALKKLPNCFLEGGGSQTITSPPFIQAELAPLTGYAPPFPELTPVGPNGEYFATTWLLDESNQPITLSVLDWNIVDESLVLCGPGGETSDALLHDTGFDFIIFDKKVLAVLAVLEERNVSNYRSLLEVAVRALPGLRGPTHFGIDPDYEGATSPPPIQMPVYVTFVDQGDLRVVFQSEGNSESSPSSDRDANKSNLSIAYVNFPMWQQYVMAAQADLASPNDVSSTGGTQPLVTNSVPGQTLPTISVQIKNHSEP